MINKTDKQSDHRFFSAMSLVSFFLVVLGFANTYGRRLANPDADIPAIIHAHGAVFFVWMILFVAQTFLIFYKKINWHKKIGNLAVLLALVMMLSGAITAIDAARSGHLGIPGVMFEVKEAFLFLNMASAFIFVALVVAGWVYRSQIQTHKRLMLMAAVAGLAPPGISRLPLVRGHTALTAALVFLMVVAGPVYDYYKNKKVHRAYWYSLPLVIFILPPVVAAIGGSSLWLRIAGWMLAS